MSSSSGAAQGNKKSSDECVKVVIRARPSIGSVGVEVPESLTAPSDTASTEDDR
ncbi:hypothetical protein Pmar_PMAR006431 [Perkinsus marinus ATCC 50983]|uniref:Uncharacterized protein n=1 Tax=Perkinsus marinus (strain ATCC 50983 / TXsc) TaxID=423536 RepID=C5K9N7_PERM5|nr:hypothetical protein Pmar_PMAR006431 [Perkinsus marinus ATCC 50983]EER18809.1 hypothetical protein Pmar_PMAR006431 [Perkinsus marinus ATCC 50983]|eukprot:XP_002787013.1 hypothetical protein Pmar_PMAR006431 [Perkinsus marinus ATCC 50983]